MSISRQNLYKFALEKNRLDRHTIDSHFGDSDVIELVKLRPTQTLKKIAGLFLYSCTELEELCSEKFSRYMFFTVFGCPLSTDIDVVCYVDEIYSSNGFVNPLFSSEIERLTAELSELGYDVSRGLDISLVTIKENNIVALSKGGRETQNIIISTHMHHIQKYPVPALEWVTGDILDKCRAIAKFYLDHLEHIALDYASVRNKKKEVYTIGTDAILDFSKTILQYINMSNIESQQWVDTMKSIVMKYIQLIILSVGKYEYTKEGLAIMIDEMFKHEFETIGTNCLWFLTRGKRGAFSDKALEFLHSKYVKIIDDYYKSFQIKTIAIPKTDLANPTALPDELYHKF